MRGMSRFVRALALYAPRVQAQDADDDILSSIGDILSAFLSTVVDIFANTCRHNAYIPGLGTNVPIAGTPDC